jgi:hypothetical protein
MHKRLKSAVLSTSILVSGGLWPLLACGQTPQHSVQRSVEDVTQNATSKGSIGPYYALLIGNNNYKSLPHLDTPVNDVKEMAKILSDQYGFKAKVLYDATRADILTAFAEYRRSLPPNANLLIYYAGHGQRDHDTGVAYWLPADAEIGNYVNWISAFDITTNIKAMPALHILIVSDSCYSGVLTGNFRGGEFDLNPMQHADYLSKLLGRRSRNILASGGDEPVSDGGAVGHSLFAAVVLQGLSDISDDEFNAEALFENIRPRVGGRSTQIPQYSAVIDSGHDGGDFIFTRLRAAHENMPECCRVHPAANQSQASDAGTSPVLFENTVKGLLTRYEKAYESGDPMNLRQLWPGISQQRLRNLQIFFGSAHSISLAFNVLEATDGGAGGATVVFSQQVSFTTGGPLKKLSTPRVVMKLTKVSSDGDWKIDSIQP